ncbi:hypothetical protein M8J75_015855 [Diaphorina citri]|nr:hypothetical protein M8J75_015855 [Diaphorina citri]
MVRRQTEFSIIDDDSAVVGINVCKTLDKGKFEFRIFDHVNITVKRNTIYGLLGASGCGKTTLLKCLLGLLPIDQGEIWILGGKPNTKNSGVPGFQVGYMPQDISLLPEHTVRGAVDEKYALFEELTALPKANLRIRTLSGGDQRKVSLVCALIHEPPLLILDEPTAGVEPHTRYKIWEYLKQITSVEKKSTVIITTHYIEETSQADRIGILRNTHIIAEESPQQLIQHYNKGNLEDTVVFLSNEQDESKQEMPIWLVEPPRDENEVHEEAESSKVNIVVSGAKERMAPTKPDNYRKLRFYNTCHKNVTHLIQNPSASMFSLVFPLIIISLLFLAMAGLPRSFRARFAVFNEDLENYREQDQNFRSNRNNMLLNVSNTPNGNSLNVKDSQITNVISTTFPIQHENDRIIAHATGLSPTSKTLENEIVNISTSSNLPHEDYMITNGLRLTLATGNITPRMTNTPENFTTLRRLMNDTEGTLTMQTNTTENNSQSTIFTSTTFDYGISTTLANATSEHGISNILINSTSESLLNTSESQLMESFPRNKRSPRTGRVRSYRFLITTPRYSEGRINALIKHRNGTTLPNVTCNDIAVQNGSDAQKTLLSCVFLSTLKEKPNVFELDYFQDAEKIGNAVESGDYSGYFLIYKNYTPHLKRKFQGTMADALLAPTSPIYVALDMTDIQRGLLVQEKLAKVQQDIWLKYRNILSPNTDPHYFRYPIVLEGDDAFCQPNNVNFVAPGVMIVMTFFLQSGLTSGTIILERSTGLWERNSVLGVTDSEIVLSHLLVMSFFAFFQSIISVILVYFLYAVPCDGSLVLVFILVFLQAINGEAFGFLCSVFARSITEVNFINLGLYYPIIHLSGVAWPLSGMSTIIRTIGYMCPLTYAIQAVRNIQSKGWGIFNIEVLAGFISSLVWIAIFCITIVGLLAVKRVR